MTQKDLFPEDPISSQPDILASPSQSLAEEKARKTTDISGQKFFPLFNPEDRLGRFSRMFVGTSLWVSTRSSLTWKEKATPQGRSLFQLSVSMHRTKGTESGSSPDAPKAWATPQATDGTRSGQIRTRDQLSEKAKKGGCKNLREEVHQYPEPSSLWLTPNAMDSLPPRSPEALKKQYDKNRKGRDTHSTLREQVVYPKPSSLWPTPRATSRMAYAEKPSKSQIEGTHGWNLNAAVTDSLSPDPHRLWPTPDASIRGARKNQNGHQVTLQDAVSGQTPEARAKMGFPEPDPIWPTPRANKVHPVITEENREKLANRNKSNLEEVVAGRMWPTPMAHEARLGYQDRSRGKKGTQESLTTKVINAQGGRDKVYGQLNPTWVEWLMGYPTEWTVLKD